MRKKVNVFKTGALEVDEYVVKYSVLDNGCIKFTVAGKVFEACGEWIKYCMHLNEYEDICVMRDEI